MIFLLESDAAPAPEGFHPCGQILLNAGASFLAGREPRFAPASRRAPASNKICVAFQPFINHLLDV